mgnify:CR=1 FL=1
MPVARSWAEELIAEYYSLKDYAVSTDVGIGAGKGGGRGDIDIVAVHPQRGDIILVDVRGIWTGNDKSICEKSLKVLKQAEEVMKRKYGEEATIVKQLIIIDHHRPKVDRIKQRMQKENVEVKTLVEVINEIIDYIDEWRKHQKELELVRLKTLPALPGRLYLLKMLEFMKDRGMLRRI